MHPNTGIDQLKFFILVRNCVVLTPSWPTYLDMKGATSELNINKTKTK